MPPQRREILLMPTLKKSSCTNWSLHRRARECCRYSQKCRTRWEGLSHPFGLLWSFGQKLQAWRAGQFVGEAKGGRGLWKDRSIHLIEGGNGIFFKDFLAESHCPPRLTQPALPLPLQASAGFLLFSLSSCSLGFTPVTLFPASSL